MEKTIFNLIVHMMLDAEGILDLKGSDKKKYVMDMLKEHLEGDIYERYSPILDLMVDGIIYLAKNKDVLRGLVSNKCICS